MYCSPKRKCIWYGRYRLSAQGGLRFIPEEEVRAKREVATDDNTLNSVPTTLTTNTDVFIQVNPSPLEAIIEGDKHRTASTSSTFSIKVGLSNDPDVKSTNHTGMTFTIVTYPKPEENNIAALSLDEVLVESVKITNNTKGTVRLYDHGGCIVDTKGVSILATDLVFVFGKSLTVNNVVVFKLYVQKDDRITSTEIDMNIFIAGDTDSLLNNIDDLLASGDTSAALMVIDMVTGDLDGGSVSIKWNNNA